jgi:hypothetical protein
METWIWISLYIVQALVGAVLWRKYASKEGFYRIENGLWALFASSLVISNLVGLLIMLGWFIDFLAGVKKTEEK